MPLLPLEDPKQQFSSEANKMATTLKGKLMSKVNKAVERNEANLIRETDERAVRKKTGFILLYPLMTYEDELKIEKKHAQQEKKLKQMLESTRQELMDMNHGKGEINEKEHVYRDDVRKYVFDLYVQRNPKGEILVEEEKTQQQLDEIEFQN